MKEAIIQILFYKWWLRALVKPSENRLIKNCNDLNKFMKLLKEAIEILKLIISENPLSKTKQISETEKNFILSKR